MNQNDIALELNALSDERYNLGKRIGELERLASLLEHNMSVASKDFNSVNYERAEKTVASVLRKMTEAAVRLQSARVYLNGLEDRAENYLRCKYNG